MAYTVPGAGSVRPATRTRSAARTTAVELRPCTAISTTVSRPCTAPWAAAHAPASYAAGGGGTLAGGWATT